MLRYFDFTMCTPANNVFFLRFSFFFDLAYVIDVYIDILYMNVWRVYDSFFFGLFLLTSSSTLLSHHRTYMYAILLYSSFVSFACSFMIFSLQFSNSNFTHSGDDEMDYICIGMSTDCCQMQRKLRVLHNQKCHDMDIGQLDNATTFNTFSFLFCLVTTWWQRALHAMDVHVHERRALECARRKQKTWNFYENFVWFSIFIFFWNFSFCQSRWKFSFECCCSCFLLYSLNHIKSGLAAAVVVAIAAAFSSFVHRHTESINTHSIRIYV